MPTLPNDKIYIESTAAQLLKYRVDNLIKEGGLDYKELNNRIIAENRTDDIKYDHNPIYGGISKEVCAVERQESFTISDNLESFDKKCYLLTPRKLFIKTSDTTVVTSANGFYGDELEINVNTLLNIILTQAVLLNHSKVDGVFDLDKPKLIIDESVNNPWNINFSNESAIKLKINPFKQNVIPLVFNPSNKNLDPTFFNVSLIILDERERAVIPKIEQGVYVTVAELNSTNSSFYKNKKGETITQIEASIVGKILNSETNEELTNITCNVNIGNKFPEMPTNYKMVGVDDVTKGLNTLYASVTISQATIRDLNIVLPVIYLSDERDELIPITSLVFEQTSPIELNYENTNYSFRGEYCRISSENVSSYFSVTAKNADNESVTITIGDVIVEKSLNKDQKSSKATLTLTDENNIISPMTYNVEIDDQRPYKEKEYYKITSSFTATIESSDWNAGSKGQEWIGDTIEISGNWSKIENQFGKQITPSDILMQSFTPINVNLRILSQNESYPLKIDSSTDVNGSTSGESVLYVLQKDMTVLSIPVTVAITDNRD